MSVDRFGNIEITFDKDANELLEEIGINHCADYWGKDILDYISHEDIADYLITNGYSVVEE